MFCPKCGSKDVVDVFCKKCLREEKPLVESFKPFEVKVCTASKRIFYHGTWQESKDPDVRIGEMLAEHVIPTRYVEIKQITVEPITIAFKDGLKQEGEALVTVTGRASEKAEFYDEEYLFPYIIHNTLSPKFGKHAQYLEGVLQVRNEDEETLRFLFNYLQQHGTSIAKRTEQKNGTDYFLSSKTIVERAAYALQEKFGGLVKTSAQLFGRDKQRSRNLYRVNALIEMPPFKEGAVIKTEKDVLLLLERQKRLKFYSLVRGRLIYHEYKQLDWKQLPIVETTVAANTDELTVLHPETFQEEKVWNQKVNPHDVSEHVTVVIDEKKLYLVERV